jgi:hypothetical protein
MESTATREVVGSISLSTSKRFPASCCPRAVTPVMLLPGFAKLAISRSRHFPVLMMTMGIAPVAFFAAMAPGRCRGTGPCRESRRELIR